MSAKPARFTPEGIYIGETLIPASILKQDVSITNDNIGSKSPLPIHAISIELVASTVSLEGGNYEFCEPQKNQTEPDVFTNITPARAWSTGVTAASIAFMDLLAKCEHSPEILKALAANNPYTVGKGEPSGLTNKHIVKPSL